MAYATIARDADSAMAGPFSANSMRSRRRHGKEGGYTGQASWTSSVINLLNTIVGAGCLAMPLAMANLGMVLGSIVILWAGITSGFGLYLQTRCARYVERGSASFFSLSQITYPSAAFFFDTAIAIKCFGVGVSYLIIIGDLMPGVVKGFAQNHVGYEFLVDRHFWITAFMIIVIPLSFLRRLDSLKYTSIIALTSIGYLIILVLAHFIKGDTKRTGGPLRIVHWAGATHALTSFPVIVFAYTCHQNMFSILNEIQNNSHFRTTSVVSASIGTAAFVYLLIAITGYLSFGNGVSSNIVAMYAPAVASTIGKAAIVVLVMFSYPLQVHPCRASIDAVLRWRPAKRGEGSPNSSPSSTGAPLLNAKNPRMIEMSDLRFAIITTLIIVASYAVAMTVNSLAAVLAYVGSTGSTSISFILPGLMYYKISSPNSAAHQRLLKEDDEADDEESGNLLGGGRVIPSSWRKGLLRKASLALAIYGVVVMVTCLILNIYHHSEH